MPGSFAIRAVRAGDLAALLAIERATFADPWSQAGFAGALGVYGSLLLCACEPPAGEVVGYVVAWFVADEGQIANLAVLARTRGQGVGGQLLDATLAAAAARDVTRVTLEVRESNTAALALYRSRGFSPVGRRPGYYRSPEEDAVVLRWDAALEPADVTPTS